uniref:Uncharacterized protein n=1 Tax=Panagrolaimus sp. PS1159 TaxID=55785 RepID=A0AC35ETK2_9BILA
MSDPVKGDSKPLTATEIAQMDPRIDLSTGFCFKIPATRPDAWGPSPSPKRITHGVTPLPLINVDVMRIYFPDYPDYDVEARKKELQALLDAQPPTPVLPAFPEYVKRPGRGRGYPNNRGGDNHNRGGYGQSDRGNSGFNSNRGGYGGGNRGGFNQNSSDGFASNPGGRGGYNQNAGDGFSSYRGGGGFNQNSSDGFASNRG